MPKLIGPVTGPTPCTPDSNCSNGIEVELEDRISNVTITPLSSTQIQVTMDAVHINNSSNTTPVTYNVIFNGVIIPIIPNNAITITLPNFTGEMGLYVNSSYGAIASLYLYNNGGTLGAYTASVADSMYYNFDCANGPDYKISSTIVHQGANGLEYMQAHYYFGINGAFFVGQNADALLVINHTGSYNFGSHVNTYYIGDNDIEHVQILKTNCKI